MAIIIVVHAVASIIIDHCIRSSWLQQTGDEDGVYSGDSNL